MECFHDLSINLVLNSRINNLQHPSQEGEEVHKPIHYKHYHQACIHMYKWHLPGYSITYLHPGVKVLAFWCYSLLHIAKKQNITQEEETKGTHHKNPTTLLCWHYNNKKNIYMKQSLHITDTLNSIRINQSVHQAQQSITLNHRGCTWL